MSSHLPHAFLIASVRSGLRGSSGIFVQPHVGHNLAVVRREFVVGRFGVGAVCDVVVQHREVFH